MTPEIAQLHDDIEHIALEWAADFMAQRREYLRRRKIKASGRLSNELEYGIDRQARQDAVVLLMAFEDYGRYLDMKRLNPAEGGRDYIQGLIEWIRSKGLEAKMVAGWQRRNRGRSVPQDVLNKIAWGIVKKRNRRPRRKQWWNKAKSAAITDLFSQVAAMVPDEVMEQLKNNFKSKE